MQSLCTQQYARFIHTFCLQTVDYCFTVFNFFHCFLASIVLAIYASLSDELIAADVFGFLLTILYAIEMYFNKSDAPANLSKAINTFLMIKLFKAVPVLNPNFRPFGFELNKK